MTIRGADPSAKITRGGVPPKTGFLPPNPVPPHVGDHFVAQGVQGGPGAIDPIETSGVNTGPNP